MQNVDLNLLHEPKLNQTQAAAALGMSVNTFKTHLGAGNIPKPLMIAKQKRWLERE